MTRHTCPECNGTGRLGDSEGWYWCDGCNGTGIEGNPLLGCLISLLLFLVIGGIYAVWTNW